MSLVEQVQLRSSPLNLTPHPGHSTTSGLTRSLTQVRSTGNSLSIPSSSNCPGIYT
jgi:hypothetical protein